MAFMTTPNTVRASTRRTLGEIQEHVKKIRPESPSEYESTLVLSPPPLPLPKSKFRQPLNNKPTSPQYTSVDERPVFDLPVTYNRQVKVWIKYFQGKGKNWFKQRLERSHRYLPLMKKALGDKGLPQDLAYLSMIESGFSAHAVSTAKAVGYWQFIKPTANFYGLKTNWWIDERRDFAKSTRAATHYLSDLYYEFRSWYLTAAAYNMGETRLRKLINKYKTRNFWALAKKRNFPKETSEYIPKLLAAVLIAKAPKLYGFSNVKPLLPYKYEYIYVPGGTDIYNLATFLGVSRRVLKKLNPELTKGFIPPFVKTHRIRIPRGFTLAVSKYLRTQIGG